MITQTLLLLALSLSSGADSAAIDIPLKYMKCPEQRTTYLPTGIVHPEKRATLPEGEWKLPELKSESPVYALVRLGDRDLLFILDRKEKTDAFFNRIYFDANGNKDLTDDPLIDGSLREVSSSGTAAFFADFPVVDTRIEVDGKKSPYSFQMRLYHRRMPSGNENVFTRALTFYISNNCVYNGTFDLDGKTYRVMLGDNNFNGRFGDRYRPLDPSKPLFRNDTFYLTTEGTVAFQDGLEIGDYLCLEGRLFEVGFHPTEGKMTLTPRTGNLRELNFSMATERAFLAEDDGGGGLMLFRTGKKIAVPEGTYRLLSYQATREDDGGNLWRLKALGQADGPPVTVNATGHSMLRFGEPYHPSVKMAPLFKDGKPDPTSARLSFMVLGAAGERLTDLRSLTSQKSRIERSLAKTYLPKEAGYRIVGPDGKVAAQGAFKYG